MIVLGLSPATAGVAVADLGDDGGSDGKSPSAPTGGAERPAAGGSAVGTVINVWAEDMNVSSGVVPTGSASARPVCTYTLARTNRPVVAAGAGGQTVADRVEPTSYRTIDGHDYVDAPGPGIEAFMVIECSGQATVSRWVPTAAAVDVGALVATAIDRARATVPAPVLDINPPPDAGAPVQLGLWLAVADPGQVNVVAQVGPVWAAVTARFTGVTWDMGNGDVVECVGVGTPLADGAEVVEEGPCGYTYHLPSDLGTRRITATGEWSARLTTSTGRDEALAPITAATTFDYRVYEVVTVGGPG